jgi:hypothetical protein
MLNPIYGEIDDLSPHDYDSQDDKNIYTHQQETHDIKHKSDKNIRVANHDDEHEIIKQDKEYFLQYPIGILKVKVLENDKFLFHDYNNVFIGQYTIGDIINYVVETVNPTAGNTMKLDTPTKKLIELTICKHVDDSSKFKLNGMSPFMNDIDLLIILNKMLKNFETNNIHKFVSQHNIGNNPEQPQIIGDSSYNVDIIRKFIYSFVEHTINIISTISNQLKDGNNITLKNKLMGYSISLVYRLTQYMSASIISSENKYLSILSTVETLKSIEEKMQNNISLFVSKK